MDPPASALRRTGIPTCFMCNADTRAWSARRYLDHVNSHEAARRSAAATTNGSTLRDLGLRINAGLIFGLTEEAKARFPGGEAKVHFSEDVAEAPAPRVYEEDAPEAPAAPPSAPKPSAAAEERYKQLPRFFEGEGNAFEQALRAAMGPALNRVITSQTAKEAREIGINKALMDVLDLPRQVQSMPDGDGMPRQKILDILKEKAKNAGMLGANEQLDRADDFADYEDADEDDGGAHKDTLEEAAERLMRKVVYNNEAQDNGGAREDDRDGARSDEVRRIARAKHLLNKGLIREAARALDPKGILPLNEHVVAEMHRLHSTESQTDFPKLPDDTPPMVVDKDVLLRIVFRRKDNALSRGPSGWCRKLLQVICKDKDLAEAVRIIVENICNGAYTGAAKELLKACKGIPLAKQEGDEKKEKATPRPVAVGEVFVKLAALYALHRVGNKKLEKLLAPYQLGLSKAGVERVIHTVRSRVEVAVNGKERDFLLLGLDISNAFNTVRRKAMLDSLFKRDGLSALFRVVDFCYNGASQILLHDSDRNLVATVESSTGVRQGDPLASFLFALTIQPALEKAGSCEGVKLVAIMDDIYVMGPADAVKKAFKILLEELTVLGMKLNASKTRALPVSPSAETSEWISAKGFRVSQHYQVFPLLGAAISSDDKALIEWLTARLKDLKAAIKRVCADGMESQHAHLLARSSLVAKVTFLTRTMPPEIVDEALKDFDDTLKQAMCGKLGLKLGTEMQHERYALPLTKGGLGLRKTHADRHIAYFASFMLAIADCPWLDRKADKRSPALKAFFDAHRAVNALGSNLIPTSREALWVLCTDKAKRKGLFNMQRQLMGKKASLALERLLKSATASPDDKAALLSASRKGAGLAFSLLPRRPDLRFSSADYNLSVQLWMNDAAALVKANPESELSGPLMCVCGKPLIKDNGDLELAHVKNCKSMRYGAHTRTHDNVAAVFTRFTRRAGLETQRECEVTAADGTKVRVDLVVTGEGGTQVFADFAFTNPISSSYISAGSDKSALTAAKSMEKVKHAKYAKFKSETTKVMPVVVESFGAWGKEAQAFRAFLKSAYAARKGDIGAGAFMYDLNVAVAVTLQRSNARALRTALRQVGMANRRRA